MGSKIILNKYEEFLKELKGVKYIRDSNGFLAGTRKATELENKSASMIEELLDERKTLLNDLIALSKENEELKKESKNSNDEDDAIIDGLSNLIDEKNKYIDNLVFTLNKLIRRVKYLTDESVANNIMTKLAPYVIKSMQKQNVIYDKFDDLKAYCPSCGIHFDAIEGYEDESITWKNKFCRNCGQALSWER